MKTSHIKFNAVLTCILAIFAQNTQAESKLWKNVTDRFAKQRDDVVVVKNLTPEVKEKIEQQKVFEDSLNKPIREDIRNLRGNVGIVNCLSQSSLKQDKILTLMEAVEKAVCNNPETHNAWIQTKIQAAQVGIAKSAFYPQFSATLNYDWGKDDYQVDQRPDLSYDTDTRRYGIAVQANWLLYDFGAQYYQKEEAERLLAMYFAQQDYVLQDVILKTISAYYEVIQQELKLKNLKQLVIYAEQNYDIAHARYKAGAGIKSDELQMFANFAKAQSNLTMVEGDLKIAKGSLASVIGEPAFQDFTVESQIKIPKALDLKPIKELLNQAEEQHPRLKAAKLAIDAAESKLKSVKRSKYPTLTFTSAYNFSTQMGQSPFGNDTQQIEAGVKMNLPVFDGFNRKNQQKVAQGDLYQKQIEEDRTRKELVNEIWKNYNQLQASYENIKALSALDKSAEKAYEVVRGRYKGGVGNMNEVFNSQNLSTEAKMNYSTALTEFLVLRYQLLSNIGNLNIWTEKNTLQNN